MFTFQGGQRWAGVRVLPEESKEQTLDETTCGIRLKAVAWELLHFQIWLKQRCLSISCEPDAGYTGEKQHRIVLYPVHEGFLDREGV